MQVVIDVSGWTQEQRNYLQAAAVSLLFQAGITYGKISVKNNVLGIVWGYIIGTVLGVLIKEIVA